MTWQYLSPKQTVFDKNSENNLSQRLNDLKVKKPLIVISKRLSCTSKASKLLEALKSVNIVASLSNHVAPEAPIELPAKIAEDFTNNDCDSIVAIGGGSVIDLAKAASILISNGGDIENYLGINNVPNVTIPKIFISTTSGTGSEATNISVLGDIQNQSKKGIVSKYLFADTVILDPTYTYSMPSNLKLNTGLDALCQCIEGITSKNASPITNQFAYRGIELIASNLAGSLENDKTSMDNVYLGAYFSGLVISGGNAGTNLGHAIGNTIGGIYHTAHGLSVTVVLEQIINHNKKSQEFINRIKDLEKSTGINIFDFIQKFKNKYSIPSLSEIGVERKDFEYISEKVMNDQQRLLNNNLLSVTAEDIVGILKKSFQ